MLALEVEYIHSETNILENRVVLDNFLYRTVVVKEYVFQHGAL